MKYLKETFKFNIKLFIIYFAIIITIFIPYTYYNDQKIEQRLREFYQMDINGRITTIKYYKAGSNFTILQDSKAHSFELSLYNKSEGSLDVEFFYDVALKGDSIYKPAYSDTIYIYRNLKNVLRSDGKSFTPGIEEYKFYFAPRDFLDE